MRNADPHAGRAPCRSPPARAPARIIGRVIDGAHVIIYSGDAEADRAFFRDVLQYPNIDAGGDWLVFKLPPAELAVHPADASDRHELYLMCDDLDATLQELSARGARFDPSVTEARWGRSTKIRLPGGGKVGLYEPRHERATEL